MRMKYDVMRGDSLHPLFATPPSPTTASHDFEVLHVVDCGRRGEGRKIDSAAPVFYHHFRVLGEGKEGGKARHAPTPPPPRQKPPKPKPAAEALPSSS